MDGDSRIRGGKGTSCRLLCITRSGRPAGRHQPTVRARRSAVRGDHAVPLGPTSRSSPRCLACGFEAQYGVLGRDFIHVHRVREISALEPGYRVDPDVDLIPL